MEAKRKREQENNKGEKGARIVLMCFVKDKMITKEAIKVGLMIVRIGFSSSKSAKYPHPTSLLKSGFRSHNFFLL